MDKGAACLLVMHILEGLLLKALFRMQPTGSFRDTSDVTVSDQLI